MGRDERREGRYQPTEEQKTTKSFLTKDSMIFHSRISENKIQSFITIAFYVVIFHADMGMRVSVLLHYLVLGREADVMAAVQRQTITLIKRKPRPDEARSLYD